MTSALLNNTPAPLDLAKRAQIICRSAALSREHEILHTFLAERLWNHGSHALWGIAHDQQGEVAPIWVQEEEGALVLAFQVYLNGGPEDPVALQAIHAAGLPLETLRVEAQQLLRSF